MEPPSLFPPKSIPTAIPPMSVRPPGRGRTAPASASLICMKPVPIWTL